MPVTLLDPQGHPREIPDDQVQAAIAAGGKKAIKITDPKGTLRWIPEDQKDAALQAGGKMADSSTAPDTRNLFQKAKDNFNANTQGAKPGDSPVKAFVENVGQGGGQIIRSLAHPLDSISSTITALSHPLDTAHGEVDALYADPNRFIGNAVGQLGTGAIVGEIGSRLLKPVETLAKKGAGRLALLGKTPEAAYESALKPSTALSPVERSAVVKTGLEQGIPISKGGIEKLGGKIDSLNQAIKDEIAADPNRPINTVGSLRNLDSVRSKFGNQVTPQPDLAEISAVENNFLNNPKIKPQGSGPSPGSLPASEAQAMKSGTYKALGDKAYGEVKGASIEAQKSLARGLKEEIANQFPEIAKLNADESRLLDLQPVLERAVNRISNHQAIGIGTPVAGAAAKAVTGSGGLAAVASVLKGVLDNPGVKSRLAIAISKSSKIPISQAAARVQAYSVSLGATAASSPGGSPDDTPNQ